MKKNFMRLTIASILFIIFQTSYSQTTLDSKITQKELQQDLAVWKKVRSAANSGLYKYRSKFQIDSIYEWADKEIANCITYQDFYKILSRLNDFEGSLHNSLYLPPKVKKSIKQESFGYFPLPIKIIEGIPLINYENDQIPLGAQLISINQNSLESIIPELHKFYSTDGLNLTGKKIGISENFGLYYRYEFGLKKNFEVTYIFNGSETSKTLSSISCSQYYERFDNRHSLIYDDASYKSFDDLVEGKGAYYFQLHGKTGVLTLNSFLIGWHKKDPKHITYTTFLDSIFSKLQSEKVENLVVDVRHNGGGSDPNDLVTLEYLIDRSFSENLEAWISFDKIPYWRYIREVSFFMRPIEKHLSNKGLKSAFPIDNSDRFYQGEDDQDKQVRYPKPNAFKGKVYLLVGPRTASAGSLFAAMLASNSNCTVIGEETQGGYFGHNGHSPIRYRLPNSKIKFMFSIVNLQQDVLPRANQLPDRGVMPDLEIKQSRNDFMKNEDTVMNYVLEAIRSGRYNLSDSN